MNKEYRRSKKHRPNTDNTNDNNRKARNQIEKNAGFLIGTINETGKHYYFYPRKIGKYFDRLPIQNEKLIKPGINGLYLAKVVEIPRKKLGVKIEKCIGKAGNLDNERESLIFEYQLSQSFSHTVESETEKLTPKILKSDLTDRTDLRSKLIFTIDGERARDYDDAVGIEKINSGYRLWVSIADVSHYVKEDSELDKEAYKRATSIYLVKNVIPMLPEKLSNDLCSLVPGKNRLTKTVEIIFDHDGKVKNYKIYNSIIKSKHRLTYTKVSEILNGIVIISENQKSLYESLKLMQELFQKIKSIRLSNGYIDLNIPDAEIVEDDKGNVIDIVRLRRDVAHEIIEQFMISANEAVAEFISKARRYSIYRVHETPDPESIIELKNNLSGLGYKSKKNSLLHQKEVQKILSFFVNKKQEYAANLFLLRSMKRAMYSSKNTGHFGLGSRYYTHFTSPIRRYPDLIVHRVLNTLIHNNNINSNFDQEYMTKVCNNCTAKEVLSDEIERESVKLERAFIIKNYVGDIMKGFIISIKPFGIFVELEEIFAEGFIPRRGIKGYREKDYYIGQEIDVKIKNADIDNRRVRLELAL